MTDPAIEAGHARRRYDREKKARLEAEAIAEKALADFYEASQRLEEAQRLSHLGSWAWDILADRVEWSPEMYAIMGVPIETSASYQSFLDLVHPEDRSRVDACVREGLRTQEPMAFEHRIVRRDGTMRILEARGRVQRVAEGRPLRMTGTALDVTERRRAEADRKAAEAKASELAHLKEIDAFKTQFLNTAAHELGTPLTPIRLQLHRLAAGAARLAPADREAIAIIDRNATRLAHLVGDILEAVRVQAGDLGLTKKAVAIQGTIAEAVEAVKAAAEAKGVTIESESTEITVLADPDRIARVFSILLSNALKFTPRGGRVRIQVNSRPGEVVVHVQDSGIGLPPGNAGNLFRPFVQVHDTMAITEPGAGLGLYLARSIVGLHGGAMWAESPGPGKGATFSFRLPA